MVLPGCVPQPLALGKERGRGRGRGRGRDSTIRGVMLACRLMVVVAIPEDSLIGGETFPAAK